MQHILQRSLTTSIRMRQIRSAGCLIIGDEILSGKTLDTNSFQFAKYCFDTLSIPLKKTIVCMDEMEDIASSLKILTRECDFIVTSGGIGPTHDDVTYEAIAAAYDVPCKLDEESLAKMKRLRHEYMASLNENQLKAHLRMVTLPVSTQAVLVEKIYADESLWVPIVEIDEQVYILPGIPALFLKLLKVLGSSLKSRVVGVGLARHFVKTSAKESSFAPFLEQLQQQCNKRFGVGNVKLGSYPHLEHGVNVISIISSSKVTQDDVRSLIDEIILGIGGGAVEISRNEEEELSASPTSK